MHKPPLESDWKVYSKRIAVWRDRYLARRNAEILAIFTDEARTPSEQFWDTKEEMDEEARILHDSLGRFARSQMRTNLLVMYQRHGGRRGPGGVQRRIAGVGVGGCGVGLQITLYKKSKTGGKMKKVETGPIISFGYWVQQRRPGSGLTRPGIGRAGSIVRPVQSKRLDRDERRPSSQIAALLADHLLIPEGERERFIGMARGEFVATPISLPDLASLPPFLWPLCENAKNTPSASGGTRAMKVLNLTPTVCVSDGWQWRHCLHHGRGR